MSVSLKTRVAIFGGGVAGLWLLNRLRQMKVDCLLIENNRLGGGQTIYSQGIIHSGVKYALTGKLTVSAESMKAMPDVWRKCLEGGGEIDLSNVTVLSEHQYLWSPGSLAANLTAFLASKNLKSQVTCLTKPDYPEAFSSPDFKGAVYRLEEPVLAVKTLVEALAAPHQDFIVKADVSDITLEADHIVLLAGKGNQALAQHFGLTLPKMQLRPLLMVAVMAPHLPILYAHAMQASDKPRITITTHQEGENVVWYLGGDLAETGVNRTTEEQIAFTKKELKILFPHIDFSTAKFDTFFIERAEMLYEKGKKPDGPSMIVEKNVIVGWPTKLAFAPLLAQQIMERLGLAQGEGQVPLASTSMPPMISIMPVIANYPWNNA